MKLTQVRENIVPANNFPALARELDTLARDHGHAINILFRQWVATTFAEFTADQHNLDIGDAQLARFSSDASRNITGFGPGIEGRILPFVNIGTQNIILIHNSVLSDAANRILTRTGADVTYGGNVTGLLWYDLDSLRWRVFV